MPEYIMIHRTGNEDSGITNSDFKELKQTIKDKLKELGIANKSKITKEEVIQETTKSTKRIDAEEM